MVRKSPNNKIMCSMFDELFTGHRYDILPCGACDPKRYVYRNRWNMTTMIFQLPFWCLGAICRT